MNNDNKHVPVNWRAIATIAMATAAVANRRLTRTGTSSQYEGQAPVDVT